MKLLVDGNATLMFDVRKDLGERNDLAKRQQALANKLRPMLNAWEADVDAEAVRRNLKAPPAPRGGVRGPGSAAAAAAEPRRRLNSRLYQSPGVLCCASRWLARTRQPARSHRFSSATNIRPEAVEYRIGSGPA
jgi:hypothetical protein